MIKFCLLSALLLFSSHYLHAEEAVNLDEAEILKLRIKELELKKEILELEAKSGSKNPAPYSYQPYVGQTNSSGYSNPSSNGYIRGPRGGCYTFSKSGNKRYVDRSLCN